MSSAEVARFPPPLLERLAAADEVQMETPRADGSMSSRPIWVVVVDDVPYVRSYRGTRGAWWRHLQRGGRGRLVVDGEAVDVAAQPLSEQELGGELNRRVSQAYVEKYAVASPGPTRTMVTDEIAATTLRLVPAGG